MPESHESLSWNPHQCPIQPKCAQAVARSTTRCARKGRTACQLVLSSWAMQPEKHMNSCRLCYESWTFAVKSTQLQVYTGTIAYETVGGGSKLWGGD